MNYNPTNWQNGDIITAERLNKLENGVAESSIDSGSFDVGLQVDEHDMPYVSKDIEELIEAYNDGKTLIAEVGGLVTSFMVTNYINTDNFKQILLFHFEPTTGESGDIANIPTVLLMVTKENDNQTTALYNGDLMDSGSIDTFEIDIVSGNIMTDIDDIFDAIDSCKTIMNIDALGRNIVYSVLKYENSNNKKEIYLMQTQPICQPSGESIGNVTDLVISIYKVYIDMQNSRQITELYSSTLLEDNVSGSGEDSNIEFIGFELQYPSMAVNCTHTYAQIMSAINQGKDLIATLVTPIFPSKIYTSEIYPSTDETTIQAEFFTIGTNGTGLTGYDLLVVVDANGVEASYIRQFDISATINQIYPADT